MQEIIKNLIRIDKEAQKKTKQAIENKDKADETLKIRIEEMRIEYLKKADNECRIIEEKLKKEAKAQISHEKEKVKRIIESLDKAYEENSDKWVDEIVARVIGEN